MGTNITINTLCDIMNNKDIGDPLARYAKVNSLILQTYGAKCLDSSYKSLITSLQNTSWSSSASEGGNITLCAFLTLLLFVISFLTGYIVFYFFYYFCFKWKLSEVNLNTISD